MKTDLSNKSFKLSKFQGLNRDKIYFGFLQNYHSPHTKKAYSKDLKEFLQFLRKHFPQLSEFQVEHPHIVAYRDWLTNRGSGKEKLGKRTINRKLATLGAFYRYLYQLGHIDRIPTDRLKRYKIEKGVVTNDLSDDEVLRMLQAVDCSSGVGKLHRAVLRMFFSTGMRLSELTGLKFSNIKYEQELCFLEYQAKGGRLMRTPLSQLCLDDLASYFDWCKEKGLSFSKDDYLFRPTRNPVTHTLNRPLDPKAVRYIFSKYATQIGLEGKITPHSARATVIGSLLDKGISIHRVAEFVGHRDLSTTEAYNKRKSSLKDNLAFAIEYATLPCTTLLMISTLS